MSIDEASTPTPTSGRAPGRARPSAWSALRPLVLRLHFYAGLLVAPFILLAALTGLLYTAAPQLEEALYRDQLTAPAPPDAVPLPLSEQVAAAMATEPDGTVTSVWPAEPGRTTRVTLAVPELTDGSARAVFVDPSTGQVHGALNSDSDALPVKAWLNDLHGNLHLGETGRLYSELAASWLWVVVLGGLALWIGRRRTRRGVRGVLLPEPAATGRRRTLSWHGAVGVWAAAGLLALSATGLTWSTHAGNNIGSLRQTLDWTTPVLAVELPGAAPASADSGGHEGHEGHEGHGGDAGPSSPTDYDAVYAAAREAGLTGPLDLRPPEGPDTAAKAQETVWQWPMQRDAVAVDPASGEVTGRLDFADYPLAAQLTSWGIALHMGQLFGLPNQIALAALAVAAIALIGWGYRMWWQRRPTRDRFLSAGRPLAPRGAWRGVPRWQLAVIAAVGIGVGVFLPVLGVSLLVFLVLDAAYGRLARTRRAATADGS